MRFDLKRIAPVLFLLTFVLGGSGCSVLGSSKSVGTALPQDGIEVFFATDRARSAVKGEVFGGGRDEMSFGVTKVGIPPGHQMGKHEAPSMLSLEWTADERKHIKIRTMDHLTSREFIQLLQDAVSRSPGKELMIFVHGYNMDFREGARLLGQFAYDLKFEGPVIMFSWPSQGSLAGYTVDETNAKYATSHFTSFLKTMLEHTPAKDVNLVAHSMGNRILIDSVLELSNDLSPRKLRLFKEIVMIAPDVDADVFKRDLAPKLLRTGIPATLYASSNDRAILASKLVNGYPRLGDAGPNLVVVEGIDTVDVSNISTRALGHTYFAEDRSIMADIFALLQTGQRANRRFGLKPKMFKGLPYWTIRK